MKKKPLPKSKNSIFSLTNKINEAQDMNKVYLKKYGDKHVLEIDIEKITVNDQIRKDFDSESIARLANSIVENGLINPITVRSKEDKYELISGENRFRAYKLLNKIKIPAIVRNDIQNDEQKTLLQLTENIDRSNLNPIETAEAFMKVKKNLNLSLAQLAKKTNRSLSYLKKLSTINNLTKKEKHSFIQKKASFDTIIKSLNQNGSVTELLHSKVNSSPLLYTSTDTKISVPKFNLDFKKENKSIIQDKILCLEALLREAKEKLDKI